MLQYASCFTQIELLIHHTRRVDLHAVESQLLLVVVQELRSRGRVRQKGEGNDAHEHCAASLEDEEVVPVAQTTAFDLEEAECEETAERAGNAGSGVEDCQPSGELATTVELRLVVDHQREEGALSHAQEPAYR